MLSTIHGLGDGPELESSLGPSLLKGLRGPVGCLALATALLVAACGTSVSPTPSLPSTPTPTRRAASASDEVLAAYKAEWEAFEQAAATSDAASPGLTTTMADPLLHQIRLNLAGDKADGIVTRGTIDFHPKVASISGNAATVTDCSFSRSVLYYAASGQPVPPITQPEYNGVTTTFIQVSPGVWKAQQQTVTEGKCS